MAKGNRPRWTKSGVSNGVQNVYIRKWKGFIAYLQEHDHKEHGFRGHRKDSWPLIPTLYRGVKDRNQISELKEKQLEQFKLAIRGKRGSNPQQYSDDSEWWALGQHYELSTPLLDWSFSPYVAAYFAFFKSGKDDTKQRNIYGINKPKIEKKSTPDIRFFVPNSDENSRVLNQNGFFSISEFATSIEDWVARNFPGSKEPILTRLHLPTSEREEILAGLEMMNINHLTLFPDLHGASIYTNRKVIESYS
jgi:hypothetical protein